MKRRIILVGAVAVVVAFGLWKIVPNVRHAITGVRHQTEAAAREPQRDLVEAGQSWRQGTTGNRPARSGVGT